MDIDARMHRSIENLLSAPLVVVALIVVQLACVVLFTFDLASEFITLENRSANIRHLALETVAILCLVIAIAFEWREGKRLRRRTVALEENLTNASKAVFDSIEAHFDTWGLTPSERDVAGFVVKGLSTTEIADLRRCSEATVKAHLNAVYRKSGSRNRAEMLSHVIDSLISGPVG
jgi:DNA-binding CsgD family transcriptional regulator